MNDKTYKNPVYSGCPGDPFVLEHNGEYCAYGPGPDVPCVPVLHSGDLVSWRPPGEALILPGGGFEALWAPAAAWSRREPWWLSTG